VTGSTTRINISEEGDEANLAAASVCLSANGRLAAFDSSAFNLASDDSNSRRDVFVARNPLIP